MDDIDQLAIETFVGKLMDRGNRVTAINATQYQYRLLAGPDWNNELNLVFTNDYGHPLLHASIEHEFKKIMISMKLPERRFMIILCM